MSHPAAFALTMAVAAAAVQAPSSATLPIACNLHALSKEERARHGELLSKLKGAMIEHAPLPDGARVRVDPTRLTLAELGEWMGLEHRCCPFLKFDLHVDSGTGPVWLNLTGPEGTRELLASGISG